MPSDIIIDDDIDYAAQMAYVTMVTTMANAAVSSMMAASQANNQLFLDSARHDSLAATEDLAATVKGVKLILDGPNGSGSGADARQLKKIYRLLKQMMRQSGAPVVT